MAFSRFSVNGAGLYCKNHASPFNTLNLYVNFIYFSILTAFLLRNDNNNNNNNNDNNNSNNNNNINNNNINNNNNNNNNKYSKKLKRNDFKGKVINAEETNAVEELLLYFFNEINANLRQVCKFSKRKNTRMLVYNATIVLLLTQQYFFFSIQRNQINNRFNMDKSRTWILPYFFTAFVIPAALNPFNIFTISQ